jgi:hypothetical protein
MDTISKIFHFKALLQTATSCTAMVRIIGSEIASQFPVAS